MYTVKTIREAKAVQTRLEKAGRAATITAIEGPHKPGRDPRIVGYRVG